MRRSAEPHDDVLLGAQPTHARRQSLYFSGERFNRIHGQEQIHVPMMQLT